MKSIKEHLQREANSARKRAERAESSGRASARHAADEFARAEQERQQAEEFQRLADAQPE